MKSFDLALLNVRALRRRLSGLLVLIILSVAVCTATFAISGRAHAASHDQVEEAVANRSVLLERLGARDDTKALTTTNLNAVRQLPGVDAVEPVTQASFGYKDDHVPGALLYATTPRASLLPPMIEGTRKQVFPLKAGEVVMPATTAGVGLEDLLGHDITVQVTRSVGHGEGTGVTRRLRVVGLFDPSWQIDGPDAAYVDPATVLSWAALRAGVPESEHANVVGYEYASVVANSSKDVPKLLSRLQADGYAASSLQQQLDALPGVLDLIRIVGLVLLVSLVLITGLGAYQVTAGLGRQRRREVGILKAVGFTDGAVFRMLASEAMLVGLMGAALGLVAAVAVASVGTSLLRSRSDLREFLTAGLVTPSGATVVAATAIVLLVVAAGALVPAVRAARLSPAEAIREW